MFTMKYPARLKPRCDYLALSMCHFNAKKKKKTMLSYASEMEP